VGMGKSWKGKNRKYNGAANGAKKGEIKFTMPQRANNAPWLWGEKEPGKK